MHIARNKWLRVLILSSVYLLGALGIMATGGGGGGGGGGVRVDSIDLDPADSSTYAQDITITGNIVMVFPSIGAVGDSYSGSTTLKWRNDSTGESGSQKYAFSGSCFVDPISLIVPPFLPVTVCTRSGDSSISIPVNLALGDNRITVEADGKEASVTVKRRDDRVPPNAPINVSVSIPATGAIVSWDTLPITESPASDSFNIYFASSPGVTKANYLSLPNGAKITGATSPQNITGLVNGTVYYFVVTAVNAYGEGLESSEAVTPLPDRPTGLSILNNDGGAEVTWDPVFGAISYDIYYASSPGVTKSNYSSLPDGDRLTNVSSPAMVTGLTNGTTYYFVVTASNWVGEGTESGELNTVPLPANAPYGVKGRSANNQVTVSWDSLSYASSYNLYLATESGINNSNYNSLENGQVITSVTSPYILSGLENEERYYIVVEAVSTLGEIGVSHELIIVPGSSGWVWQNPTPTGNALWDVEFADTLNGWIVGNGGTILRTSDGGNNWVAQWEWATIDFLSVSVVDLLNVWVMGRKGYITSDVGYFLLSTNDGGITWSYHAIPSGMVLDDIDFVSPSFGWIVGSEGIYHTSDEGKSWDLQKNDNGYRARLIEAIDENNVYVIGSDNSFNNMLHSTDDGGKTWIRVTSPSGWVSKLQFLDTNNGWVANGGIQATMDGGNSWISQSVSGSPISVSFSDSANGWSVGGEIFHTIDSGTTWSSQLSGTSLSDVYAIDANTALAVGNSGSILYTEDAGSTWVNKNVNTLSTIDRTDAIDFVDGSNGWVVGRDSIARSSDGGSTWAVQVTPASRNFWDVDFVNTLSGWAVGSQRTLSGVSYINVAEVFHTSDGGISWIEQDVGNCGINCSYRTMYGVSFIDDQTGWAAGSGVFHTSDGGTSWNSQNIPGSGTLRDVYFLNENTGWAVGENGRIIHTIDGGITWSLQTSGTSYDLYSIFALDSSTAWIAGGEVNPYRPIILKTSDGGTTWQNISIDNYGRLFSIYFTDSMNGWAGGEFGEIFATQNGGNTWEKQSSSFSNGSGRITDIQFIAPLTGWATGWFGANVLKSSSGGFGP